MEGFLICISAKGARLGKPAKTRSRLLPMLNSLIKETLKLLHHGFAVHTAHGYTLFSPLPSIFSNLASELNCGMARKTDKMNFSILEYKMIFTSVCSTVQWRPPFSLATNLYRLRIALLFATRQKFRRSPCQLHIFANSRSSQKLRKKAINGT